MSRHSAAGCRLQVTSSYTRPLQQDPCRVRRAWRPACLPSNPDPEPDPNPDPYPNPNPNPNPHPHPNPTLPLPLTCLCAPGGLLALHAVLVRHVLLQREPGGHARATWPGQPGDPSAGFFARSPSARPLSALRRSKYPAGSSQPGSTPADRPGARCYHEPATAAAGRGWGPPCARSCAGGA